MVTYDAKDPDTAFPPIEPLRPPEGAPNVLVVLLDDVGFGASSAFGGPVQHADRRAAGGRGPEVHALPHDGAVLADAGGAAVGPQPPHRGDGRRSPRSRPRRPGTARCGRTRARRWRRSSGSTGTRPRRSASATRCRCGRRARPARSTAGRAPGTGSSTSTASSAARPTSGTRRCTRARRRSSPTGTPEEGYHLMADLADRAIAWIRQQKALTPDQPFFIYFAPGATHAPHHVPKEWADKYKGRFDQGWDALREQTFARQKELGRDPGRRRADRAPRRDPGVGGHRRAAQAGAGPPDGDLRRLPGVRRPPHRPADRRPRRARGARRHRRLLHHRRQRRLGRGHAASARSTR